MGFTQASSEEAASFSKTTKSRDEGDSAQPGQLPRPQGMRWRAPMESTQSCSPGEDAWAELPVPKINQVIRDAPREVT